MKKYLLSIALTVALPAMAQAQAATAAEKCPCCEKMKDMDCCKDGKMDHGAHDAHGAQAPTDPHAGHDMSKPMAEPPAPAAPRT